MPRRARITVAGVPHHVVQRGHNREATFFADEDYLAYLHSLKEGAQRYRCAIHAYALMTNHVHLLVTPASEDSLSRLMRYLGSRYVQYVNFVYKRRGTLWEGRFKSSLVDQEQYLLTCYRYIELNPVRANMVEQPQDYRWSSYASHGTGKPDDLIEDHPLYVALGDTAETRRAAYRALFRYQMEDAEIAEIRTSLNKGLAVGAERFKKEWGSVPMLVHVGPRGLNALEWTDADGNGVIDASHGRVNMLDNGFRFTDVDDSNIFFDINSDGFKRRSGQRGAAHDGDWFSEKRTA